MVIKIPIGIVWQVIDPKESCSSKQILALNLYLHQTTSNTVGMVRFPVKQNNKVHVQKWPEK